MLLVYALIVYVDINFIVLVSPSNNSSLPRKYSLLVLLLFCPLLVIYLFIGI